MTWQELRDSLDEQTMLNMLIDPSPYYNPMMTNLHAGSFCRSALSGIIFRDSGRLQEASGENKNLVEEGDDHVVPRYSKHLESMHGKSAVNVRDKGKKKLVATEMPHQLMTA